MRLARYFIYLIIALSAVSSCSKSNHDGSQSPVTDSVADIISYKIVGMDPAISIVPGAINLRFPDSVTNGKDLVASFTLSPGCVAKVWGDKQTSDATKNDFTSSFQYAVTNAQGYTKYWTINATNNDYTADWGLGNFLQLSVSNDRPYKWYYTQEGTGQYANINCAPTCAAMAMKWVDSAYGGSVADIRAYYPQNTGDWSLTTIATYLSDHGYSNKGVALGDSPEKTRDIMKAELDKGHILLIAVVMGELHYYVGQASDPKVGKFYPESYNHVLAVYGYKQVDNELYFQLNDPWGIGYVNKDGTHCSIGRFFPYQDIFAAIVGLDNNTLSVFRQ